MQDPKPTPATSPTGSLDGEAEIDEALSRAAREAVRQPADPRLEKSFARLGLFTDDDPPPRPARREPAASSSGDAPVAVAGAPAAAPAPSIDLEPIRAELAAWRTSAADLGRRLEVVTWILFALTGIVGLLAVVLIVRG